MKINKLITLLFISLICVIGIKSQETCENYNNQIVEVSVVPRYIGVVETLKITNAVSMTYSTNLGQYFSAELVTDQNEIRLSTTESFANYEKDNNVTRTVLNLNIRCSSSNTNLEFRITISSVNNYPPEFTASNYEIKIPTPLAKGAELTSYLEFDDQILATDYDLYDNSLSFTLTGSDLFYVESVDITGIKSTFKARIFTNQQIIKLENDIVELTLTATDSSNEPKSSSVKVNIFTDPENTFIESPKFSKPLYRGNLEKGKTLEIEGIQLDESTYDDNVRFEIAGDLYGIINMTSDGPAVKITLNEGNLLEEVFKQKFIDFVIEAKRDGDNSGFAVVIIDVSLPIFTFNFEKSLYEGELKEKGKALSIQGMKLSTNGSLETTSLSLSQVDAKYFDLNINADIVSIKLKEEAPINEIMTKTLLFVTVEAIQNNTVIASTNVIIKTVAILVPHFENNFYRAIIENGDLKHEGIFIIEDSISLDEEIEVSLIGTERLIFDVELTGREISFKLKTGAEIPKEKSFLTLQIQVNVKSSTKRNRAVMICELEFTSNPQEFLHFNSQLYEGKISQDLVLSSPDIILNTVENVNITLSGKHGSYFEQDFNENQLVLKLQGGVVIEQFSTDFYIQITIEASRENFTSATSNVIFGIQRNLITDTTFEKSLYIGKIDGQKELKLENLIIKSDNLFTNVRLAGDDAEFFNANVHNNVITLHLFKNITEDLLLKKTILYAKIVAEFEDSSIATNVIVTLPRPDEIKTLAFETSHTSGTIRKDELLNLEIGEFYLHPFNYDETVQFNLTGTDAHLFNLDQNLNKIQLKMNQGINEEQLNSKKFILLSVIATKEEFVKAEHFIFINVEIFNSSESMFEKTLYVGTVDEQRELQIEKLIIKSDYEFNSIEFIGDDTEYFEALIEQNQIIIRLFKNITEDLLIQKSILSTKVIAQYDDILISTNIIVKLPRPDQIKKLKFETTYTSGTIRKDTELVLELNEFSLNPTNYDDTVQFNLTGTDAHLFNLDQNLNKIQIRLKQDLGEEQLNSKKFISLSVIATKEEFEKAEHFIFINVEIFNSSESMFEKTLYVGTVDEQRELQIEKLIIKSDYEFNSIEFIGDDTEYFEALIEQNQIIIRLFKNITEDLLIQKSILSTKVIAQYDDILISTNIIVKLPRPDQIKKLKFETTYTSGTIRKDTELVLELNEFSLNPANYGDTVQFNLTGTDAHLFNLDQNLNKIQIRLKQDLGEEQLNSKKFISLSVIATKEEFEKAEHFIFINVEIFNSSESMFEKTLYVGTVDEQRELQIEKLIIKSDYEFNSIEFIGDDTEYFEALIEQNQIIIRLFKNITEDLLIQKSILSTKVIAQYDDILISTNIIVKLPRPDQIKKLKFETTYTSGTIRKDTELVLELNEFSLNPANYGDTVQFNLTGTDAHLFNLDQNLNKIQIRLKQDLGEEQLNSKKFISLSVIATKEEFEKAEHFIFINVEIFNSSESMFEKTLYVGTVDEQRELQIEKLIIKSDYEFNSIEFIGDDTEYFEALIEQNQIIIRLFKNITEDLLIQKSILSTKVIAQYDDILISTNIIVKLPRPDQIKKLKFETTYTSGTIRKDTELVLELNEFSLNPANYGDTVQFNLTGTDAHLFNLDQNLNKIQIRLKQDLGEEQLNSKKFISLSVIATKEEFEKAEHFIFINVEIFNSSESMFEKTLYVGTVDEQRELQIEKLIIKSDYEFNSIEFIGDDTEYFEALIEQNQIIIRLFKNITEDLLIQKSILSTKVIAQYDDILISTNIIVKLPRPDQIKKLKFETTYTSGTIRKDTELVLELNEFSLNPANYDDTVQFNLIGTDAYLFNLDQNLNKIQIRLKQDLGEEQLNSKKFISLSVIATKEEFEKAEHFIFINVEIFNSSESMFEKTLYVGTVDEQRELQIEKLIIKSDYEFNSIEFIGDDTEYFEALIEQNQITIRLFKNITEDLLIQKSILSTKVIAQYDDILISTNLIVTLRRPDEIQSLKFETSYSTSKIVTHPELSFELDEISLQTGNYDENVKFNLDGADADLFDIVRNAYKIQLKLKSETNSEMLIEKEVLSLIILATRENYVSAEHFVAIYIEKSSTLASDSFDKSLYIGNINEQKELDVEKMVIKSDQVFNTVEMIGDDSELFEASVKQNSVTVRLKEAIAKITLPQKSLLRAQIVAKHDDISIYTNLVVEIPQIDEEQRLSFETPYTVGNLEIYPQAKLSIQEIVLGLANYDDSVQFNLTGSDAILFELVRIGNIIQPKIKSEINEDSLENKEYFTLTLKATKQGFESAEHFIFVNILTPEIDESSFEQNLFVGSINNQRVLLLDPLLIKSERIFDEVIVADDDFEYFVASVDQNYVTITLVKEITEDLLLKTSLLSTKIIAKSGDITISSNIIVTLPKVNGDKILRFESPYYIGTLDQLELDIENVVLEMNNYDETVDFVLIGSDKDLFKIEKDQNLIKLSLANDVTQEDLQNRVFLTASITATRNEFATAETVIFVHLNVIVDEISPIEFDKVIYSGSLTFNNVLVLDRISLKSNETEIQISHKGDHADKFTINDSNLKDIHFNFIPQPLDFTSKFYHFYIEALKFGAPKVYAAVIIQIVDKIQLKFDEVNYFGSIDEKGILIMDQIPINSEMANSEVSFRLVDGHNEFFELNSTESAIQITKTMSIAVENLSFVWFYLEAYGSNYYHARTLIVVDFPQKIDTPIDECYDKLDPTQPYFESGSYSFTIMSDETGLAGQIHAIITDPEDSIVSYELLFENIFLYDKITADGGDIKLLVQIPAGFYRMKGIALSMNSNKSAETSILLRVLEPKTCEDGKPITTVQKTLAVVKIEENEIHDQIMYMTIGDCHYEIIKVVPDVLKDSLTIDSTTRYLKNIIPFDREDAVFANYSVPQLQVTLHLICPTTYLSLSDDQRIQPYMNEVFTDEILYSPSITYLNLEILDQNDNSPIFINPSNVNFRVAFPDENLIGLIMPNYLFKVEAYDIDDGINAIIRYSTSMPSIFEINTVTGEIYPLRTLPDEPTGFLITATDRAGAGLRTTTSIDFKKISRANVIEIIADNFAIKDIDRLALELSEKLEADFRVLSSSQLPFTTNSQVLRFADTQAKTKIYGYAFKTNSLDLFTPAELIEQLKELELSFPINYSAVDGCAQEKNDDDECDLTIWIFVVSFMGTVLLLILISIPIFWYFYLKKRLQNNDSNSNSSKEEIANRFYDNDSVRDSEIASEIVEAITELRTSDAQIMGVGVDGVTEGMYDS
ncbi:hypothetical protein ACKWTF_008231 [Chironomus riparius]